jgi:hypothetical protein
MKLASGFAIAAAVWLGACSESSPVRPDLATSGVVSDHSPTSNVANPRASAQGQPGYEPAYYNGSTVTIDAIETPQNVGPLEHAAADFYVVTYPTDRSLWPSPPQCNSCDHAGDGIDPTDYHDHVLDSIPSSPGHGEYNPLWHVFLILPVEGREASYAARLPMKSEAAVDAAIAAGDATEIDTGFYFICAVVNANAGK